MQSLRRTAGQAIVAAGGLGGQLRSTTILCVRKGDKVVIMGDGQVTAGKTACVKGSAKKLRRVGSNVIVGFAGSTADAMTLMEKLENKITEFPGQLLRACVELAKEWRGDKSMRQLNASMIVANELESLEIDGVGNVITPEEDGVLAVGSGGLYAKSAARALVDIDGMDAEGICKKAMDIATSIDIFSNNQYVTESIDKSQIDEEAAKKKDKEKADDSLNVQPRVTPVEGEAEGSAKEGDKKQDSGKGDDDGKDGDAGSASSPGDAAGGNGGASGGGASDSKAAAGLESLIEERVQERVAAELARRASAA